MPHPANPAASFGLPGNRLPIIGSYNDGSTPFFPERNLRLSGVTRDSNGAVLAGVSVALVETPTNQAGDTAVSDANGVYMLQIPKGLTQTPTTTWKVVAYKTGSPDVAGTTVNTLTGA